MKDCAYCSIPGDAPEIEIDHKSFDADIRLLWIVAKMYHDRKKLPHGACLPHDCIFEYSHMKLKWEIWKCNICHLHKKKEDLPIFHIDPTLTSEEIARDLQHGLQLDKKRGFNNKIDDYF
jgi:hypothetical protein